MHTIQSQAEWNKSARSQITQKSRSEYKSNQCHRNYNVNRSLVLRAARTHVRGNSPPDALSIRHWFVAGLVRTARRSLAKNTPLIQLEYYNSRACFEALVFGSCTYRISDEKCSTFRFLRVFSLLLAFARRSGEYAKYEAKMVYLICWRPLKCLLSASLASSAKPGK